MEIKALVFVNIDFDRYGRTQLAFGSLVELLDKLPNVDAVLTERGANRGRRGCLAGGDLQFYNRNQFFFLFCHRFASRVLRA